MTDPDQILMRWLAAAMILSWGAILALIVEVWL